MPSDGFSLDDKRNFINGKGDMYDIIEKLKKLDKEGSNKRNAKGFFVQFEEIRKNDFDLRISKYKEIEHEEVKYEEPEIIKEKILELDEEIIKIGE